MPKLFTSDNQPANRKSGPNIKAKIIAALGRRDMSEDDFLDLLIDKAVNEGGVFLQEVLKRYSPIPKQTHEAVIIEWPDNGTPVEKANAVLKAMSEGRMSPDVGSIFIEAISKSLGIEEVTELSKRLEAIEKLLNAKEA
jgi:hypothetical protein